MADAKADPPQTLECDLKRLGYLLGVKLVYFLRHGEADWPEWDRPDDERPLTKRGRREVKRVAKFLCRLGAEPRLIYTSPLPRAAQTAEIVAKHLCLELGCEEMLSKGFMVDHFRKLIGASDVVSMVLVGHEPDFSRVIAALTGGTVALAKSGVALVEVENAATRGKLRWLFPPKFAKRA